MASRDYDSQHYAKGVTANNYLWGTLFHGRWDALLAAGVVKPHWHPHPARTVHVEQTSDGDVLHHHIRSGVKVSIHRTSKHQFDVSVHWSEPEKRRQAHLEAVAQARDAEREAVAALPQTAAAAKRDMVKFTHAALGWIENTCARRGFRVRDPQALTRALAEVAALVERADVVLDRVARKEEIREIQRKHAIADPAFSAFLKTTVAIGRPGI